MSLVQQQYLYFVTINTLNNTFNNEFLQSYNLRR